MRRSLLAPVAALGASCFMGGADGPTYRHDIAPLVATHCAGCHSAGGLAPIAFADYGTVYPFAPLIAEVTASSSMPPWDAVDTDECHPPLPWLDDERLSSSDVAMLARWTEDGAPEGTGDVVEGLPKTQSSSLAHADLEVRPTSAFVADGAGDHFRCFVLPWATDELRYVGAIEFDPDNATIVHHAAVLVDPTGAEAARAGTDGSYECFPGSFDASAYALDAWTPGQLPTQFPSDAGAAIPAGAHLILHVHYAARAAGDTDRSLVRVAFRASAPTVLVSMPTFGDFTAELPNGDGLQPGPDDPPGQVEFRIPARTMGHVEVMRYTIPPTATPGRVLAVLAHAHQLAVDVKVEIEREGARACMLQDRWNFHWQRFYTYDAPVASLPTLLPGDRVWVRCTYDNAGFDDVLFGQLSTDEMCHAVFMLLQPRKASATESAPAPLVRTP